MLDDKAIKARRKEKAEKLDRPKLEAMRVNEMAEWLANGRHGKESIAIALEIAEATWGIDLLIESLRD